MSERLRSGITSHNPLAPKMDTSAGDLSPKKTMLVLVIVVGCFAVLWPKVFYPMLVGSAQQHIKPSAIDKTTGCCDVISEIDVNTIKILSELCGSIIKTGEDGRPLGSRELVEKCKQEINDTCGIDISPILQEHVRLGQNVKQILDEIRSLNGSLCLKYNYGVSPWTLGVPHRITVKMSSTSNIRQERPLHLGSEMIHPAFRERGRAIPQPQASAPARSSPRVVEGRPGPIPGMRPTIGGAGHVVAPSKQGTSSMSVIMPIYTIGIVIFFTYTLMKIMFKKQPEGPGGSLYPPITPDPQFRKEVFESDRVRLGPRLSRDNISSKLGDAELDHLRHRLRETELAMERIVEQMAKVPLKTQDVLNSNLLNGNAHKPQDEEQPRVTVLGMEMTASCEGGQRWSRPDSPVLPSSHTPQPTEQGPPPQEIYLEGALPPQSQLLVTDSATEAQPNQGEDPAVVLSGKMTLSVISLDSSENGTENGSGSSFEDLSKDHLQFTKEGAYNEEINKLVTAPDNEIDPVDLADVVEEAPSLIMKQIDELMNEMVPTIEESSKPEPDLSCQVDDLVREIEKDAVQAIAKILETPLSTDIIDVPQKAEEAMQSDKIEAIVETSTQDTTRENLQSEIEKSLPLDITSQPEENAEIRTEDAEQDKELNDPQNVPNNEITNERVRPSEGKPTESERKEEAATPNEEAEKLLEDLAEQIKLQEQWLLNDEEQNSAQNNEQAISPENDKQESPQSDEQENPQEVDVDEESVEEEEIEVEEDEEGEIVEIEEIVYESDDDEDIEENETRNQRVNGDDLIEESKQTSVSVSNDAAENDISEEEVTDEEIDVEEEDLVNHIANSESDD